MSDSPGESQGGGFTPPYPAFSTFNSFLTNLGSKPIPPRIDRSLMVGIANGVQTQLLAALREFQLVDEANQVTERLIEATRDDQRQGAYRAILTTYYAEQLAHASSPSGGRDGRSTPSAHPVRRPPGLADCSVPVE